MLIFHRIRYQNFLSVGETPVEIQLDKAPATLIRSGNGTGKSALLDALTYSLFGKPHRAVKVDQLVNTINGGGLLTEIEFTARSMNNRRVRIVRGHRPRVFQIWQNGERMDEHANARDFQKHLEQNILRMNYKSFTQIVVLGANNFTQFMSLPPGSRQTVIEDILDIAVLGQMRSIARSHQAELRSAGGVMAAGISASTDSRDRMRRHLVSYAGTIDEMRRSAEVDRDKEMSMLRVRSDEAAAGLDALLAERPPVEAEMTDITGRLAAGSERYRRNGETIAELENYMTRFSVMRDEHRRMIGFFSDNDVCPTCEQNITDEIRGDRIDRSERVIGELDDAERRGRIDLQALAGFNAEYEGLRETEREIRCRRDELESEISARRRTVEDLRRQLEKLADDGPRDADFAELERNRSELEGEIAEMQAEIDRMDGQLDGNRIEQMYYGLIIDMLGDAGIRTKIIRQYLPSINRHINRYLESLDLFVVFNLDDELNETIRARHMDRLQYNSFSEGEKQRIDLALLFTWREIARMKNTTDTNLLIMDEIFDSSLDDRGVENLLGIFERHEGGFNLFVISHNVRPDMQNSSFDRWMEFEKIHNFTRMTEHAIDRNIE